MTDTRNWLARQFLRPETQNEKDERERKQRIKDTIKYHEEQAVHRGRLKYLERQAAKTGKAEAGGGGGFGNWIKESGKELLSNAGSSAGKSMFDSPYATGGGRRSSGGGGFSWNPITGESHSSPHHKKKRHSGQRVIIIR